MPLESPPRRRAAALLTALAVAASTLALASPASAADGPAPAPIDHRVIAGVHTDAVSTFLDDGTLTLGSRADVAEGTGTRFAADEVWFHVEDAARTTLPDGYEFIAAPGTEVWLTPEVSPGADRLWAGFATDGIPAGAIDGDTTTFTLTDVDGPGALELYTDGGSGAPDRLWSSQDDGVRSFSLERTHKHANWAFTAPGTYRLSVDATAAVGGAVQTASATYTFVVGDLPEPVATSTTLTASATTVVTGDSVTLDAQVAPADVTGYMEFRAGSTVLGHEAVVDGAASLDVPAPAVGRHQLTAVFIPEVTNLAAESTSAPVALTVTDGSGVEFAISGVAASYRPGDVLEARVVGHALSEGQTYQWSWRPVGVTSSYGLTGTGGQEAAGRLQLPVDMSHDDYEIRVSVRENRTTVSSSAWVPLVVESDVTPIGGSFSDAEQFLGDEVLFTLESLPQAGDSVRLAFRFTSGPWEPADGMTAVVDERTLRLTTVNALNDPSWVLQTVRDGIVVAQSEPMVKGIRAREVTVQGLQGVYRVGQTLSVEASVYPELDGLVYRWELTRFTGGDPLMEEIVLSEGAEESNLRAELPIEAMHDGWTLGFTASLPEGHPAGPVTAGWFFQNLAVSDADPDTQLLFFKALGGHYHQGGEIALDLVADPAPADEDTFAWEWRWPGQDDWRALPGASGMSHRLVAEQALDGVEVRATMQPVGGGQEIVAKPVTIYVDDHGAAPRQRISITGLAESYAADEAIELAAEVEHGSVLDRWEWMIQREGEESATPLADQHGAEVSFGADPGLDGASVTARLTFADGTTYVESAPVILAVDERASEPSPGPGGEPGDGDSGNGDSGDGDSGNGGTPGSGDDSDGLAGAGAAPADRDGDAAADTLPETGGTITALWLAVPLILMAAGAVLMRRRSRSQS